MGSARPFLPHLLSAVTALGVAATMLLGGRTVALHLERRASAWTAPQRFQFKNQGMLFQRLAARARRILPIYGRSELVIGVPNRAIFDRALDDFQHGRVPGS
jgi:hypothetical protein